MKCPECERTGQRSKFYMPTGYSSTAMAGSEDYYDEDGHRHYHEVNTRGGQAHCSNGHVLNVTCSDKCQAPGCDYGSPQTITLVPPRAPEPEPSHSDDQVYLSELFSNRILFGIVSDLDAPNQVSASLETNDDE